MPNGEWPETSIFLDNIEGAKQRYFCIIQAENDQYMIKLDAKKEYLSGYCKKSNQYEKGIRRII